MVKSRGSTTMLYDDAVRMVYKRCMHAVCLHCKHYTNLIDYYLTNNKVFLSCYYLFTMYLTHFSKKMIEKK